MPTKLQFLLAIARAQKAGYHAFAAALKAIYLREYPDAPRTK